ncbi:hypothetical protein K443DRAFT_180650 [Laccaria amethystina LaAM-08-1]|uniref:Uncharacterized protein n=1 Tax=Laccaria amethystina LaAM-08-1 TaxID=1095629 RepID=A0A0C9XNG6_9AGAR|nr:hypothetical protein K443DRAFT_180650 [Laccaria amethystina LaAM-08-1]
MKPDFTNSTHISSTPNHRPTCSTKPYRCAAIQKRLVSVVRSISRGGWFGSVDGWLLNRFGDWPKRDYWINRSTRCSASIMFRLTFRG